LKCFLFPHDSFAPIVFDVMNNICGCINICQSILQKKCRPQQKLPQFIWPKTIGATGVKWMRDKRRKAYGSIAEDDETKLQIWFG
jgi:hypothetical protein